MEVILAILLNLAILAMIILIFLRFRLDRLILRVEMQWNALNLLMRYIVSDEMGTERASQKEQQKMDTFLKSKRQVKQVTAANALNDFLKIPSVAYADYLKRRDGYNSAVRTFNKKLEAPVWKAVATVFRMKPRIECVEFESASNLPEPS